MSDMKLTVRTGAKHYRITDEFGDEIGHIKFNPADLDILKRFKEVSDYFKQLHIPEKPTMEEFFSLTDDIKKRFDYLLNTNASEGIFANCGPLTPLDDGNLYCMDVMERIEKLIGETLQERTAKTKERIDSAVKDILDE